MPDSPMAFMQKSFVVPAGSWRETRHVEHFGSKPKGDVLPPGRVESGCPIGVPVGLCCKALMVEYPGFKWNEMRSTGVDVAPGLAMEKEIRRESLGEGDCSDGKFDEAGKPVKSKSSPCESPEMAYAEARAMPRGLHKKLIREEDETEIVRRINVP